MATKIILDSSKFKDERPFSERILETDDFLLIHFYLKQGQKIPMHTSPSLVLITVLEGKGRFFYGSEENFEDLDCGETIKYQPEEPHGFSALEDMVVQALVIPKPVKRVSIS
ncbi:MAG: cupin domain-containing protein [Aquificae bacterium]|nr:cupin domain-containing protein [Aquificota bacterium]